MINPNGIVFGENASLDVGASFSATTASGVRFGDQGVFSTEQADALPLLTVQPNAFVFTRLVPAGIEMQANAPTFGNFNGFRVNDGRRLLLLGGDVAVDGGGLFALGGRVELGAVAEPGTVVLGADGSLGLADGVARGTVRFEQGAAVRVDGVGGGDIGVTARDIEVSVGSQLIGGIFPGFGTPDSQAGTVRLEVTGTVTVAGASSRVENDVNSGATGAGGDLVIRAQNLVVRDGVQLSASTFGKGSAGNVQITVSDRALFQGTNANGQIPSAAGSIVGSRGEGKGGNVVIEAPVIEVLDGAQLTAITQGVGDAGNVQIKAEQIVLGGATRGGSFASGIFNGVGRGAFGQGGDVNIRTDFLVVRDGAQLIAATDGLGDGGNIRIAGDRVVFEGTSSDGFFASAAFSSTGESAIGNGGNLEILSTQLEVIDGAQVGASHAGLGQGGNVRIITRDQILLAGILEPSVIFARVLPTGEGGGGVIDLQTNQLRILDGSQIISTSEGTGIIGNILVESENIEIIGFDQNSGQASGLATPRQFTSSQLSSIRSPIPNQENTFPDIVINNPSITNSVGGDIVVRTENLLVADGASIDARTTGQANAGNVIIDTQKISLMNGGSIISTTENQDGASGQAGSIQIKAAEEIAVSGSNREFSLAFPQFVVQANSGILVQSDSLGTAGSLILDAPRLILKDGGQLIADSNAATGGNINIILSQALLLEDNGLISATAGRNQGTGDGGNITINSPFLISLSEGNSDMIANAFEGTGGNININSNAILNFQLQDEPNVDALRSNTTNDISASSAFGTSGILNLGGLNVDPSQGTTQLPTSLTDPSNQISSQCAAPTLARSEFVITGRSGLPQSPSEPLETSTPPAKWLSLPQSEPTQASAAETAEVTVPIAQLSPPAEATRWQTTANGTIQLVAAQPSNTKEVAPAVACASHLLSQQQ